MEVRKSAQSLMLEPRRKKWVGLGDGGGVGLGNEYYVHGGGDESGEGAVMLVCYWESKEMWEMGNGNWCGAFETDEGRWWWNGEKK